jgi:tetratricopeptide (TPR) repeat protein
MANLRAYVGETEALLENKEFAKAQLKIQEALKKFPYQFKLLRLAVNIFRKSRNHEESLKYAQDLIAYHPEKLQGYELAAVNLLALKRFDEAQAKIQEGLNKFPNQFKLLILANNIFRKSGNHKESLKYAQYLIVFHTDKWQGYSCAAIDLVALKRFDEALAKIREGLEKFPNHSNLLILEGYTSAFTGNPIILRENLTDIYELEQSQIVAYSHDIRYFSCIQEQRSPSHQEQNFKKNLLFVCGLGRSGTTAMGDMLSISHQVEMYTELYSAFRVDGYKAKDFSQASILSALSKHPLQKKDRSIFQKRHLSSKFVGDKRPGFQYCMESTFDNFPPGQVNTIFLVRDLFSICKSSHKRSIKPGDPWPMEKGIEFAILQYNATVRQINYLYSHRRDVFESITFTRYAEVFTDKDIARGIFDGLRIELSPEELDQFDDFTKKSADLVNSKSTKIIDLNYSEQLLDDSINAAIERYVDAEAHRQFCRISKMPDFLNLVLA